jgi:hypothetical protein
MPTKQHRPRLDSNLVCFRLRIRRSRIERLGVFTEETIPPRKRVIQYTGERISKREVARRTARMFLAEKAGRVYMVRVNGRSTLDGAVGEVARSSLITAVILICRCAEFVGKCSCIVSEKSGQEKSLPSITASAVPAPVVAAPRTAVEPCASQPDRRGDASATADRKLSITKRPRQWRQRLLSRDLG